MKKASILGLMICLLCGCQTTPKEPLTKSCSIRQNDMSIVFDAISSDHEKVTSIEAEMYMSEGAMVNYGFGNYETAKDRLQLSNDALDAQECDGYQLELIYDGNFYIMKMKIDFEEIDEEMLARLSIDVDSESFLWQNFSEAVLNGGGSCQ